MMSHAKIYRAIEECLGSEGYNLWGGCYAIYPYGNWGKVAKIILNEDFGIQEKYIADNYLSEDNRNILNVKQLVMGIDEPVIILLATDNDDAKNILYHETASLDKVYIKEISRISLSLDSVYFDFLAGKLRIDEADDIQKNAIFEKTVSAWKKLGEEEPYWSVITHNQYKMENMDSKCKEAFYKSGILKAQEIVRTLVRNGFVSEPKELKGCSIIEYGCGCGRVTMSLSDIFGKVVAVDISPGNLGIAQSLELDNTEFVMIEDMNDYPNLPMADVVYSYIVLQHNTPPVMEYILNSMLGRLKSGGVAIFQIPTYRRDYTFNVEEYMKRVNHGMEMHVFPQQKIFEIADENHCIPKECFPDNCTGLSDCSMRFVFQKR